MTCEGELCLGATGSGKSTGSGQALAMSCLAAGFGGLVLTAKPDKRALWESYCRRAGRLADLCVFSPSQPCAYDFLDFECSIVRRGAGITNNIVHLLCEVLQVAERQSDKGAGKMKAIWRRATRQLLRNVVDLVVMAKGTLSVPDVYQAVISAPTSLKEVGSAEWQRSSFCYRCLRNADARSRARRHPRDFKIVADFFLLEWPGLSERTRSVVQSTFTSMIDVIHRGILSEPSAGGPTSRRQRLRTRDSRDRLADQGIRRRWPVCPGVVEGGVPTFDRTPQSCHQSSTGVLVGRRGTVFHDDLRHAVSDDVPCFARGNRVLDPEYFELLCGAWWRSRQGQADSLFANLNTKIFHANGDPVTNEWAASLIGRSRQFLTNSSTSQQAGDWFSEMTGMGTVAQDERRCERAHRLRSAAAPVYHAPPWRPGERLAGRWNRVSRRATLSAEWKNVAARRFRSAVTRLSGRMSRKRTAAFGRIRKQEDITMSGNQQTRSGDVRQAANWVQFIVESWAVSVEVFLRREFGWNYIGAKGAAVLLLVPMFMLLWPEHDPRPLLWFLRPT